MQTPGARPLQSEEEQCNGPEAGMTVADSKNSTVSNGKAAGDEVKQVIKGNSDLTGSCKAPKKKNQNCGLYAG